MSSDDKFLKVPSNSAGLIVGPVAALLLITGNVGVILGLFPAHVAWTVYTLLKCPLLPFFHLLLTHDYGFRHFYLSPHDYGFTLAGLICLTQP